MSDGGKTARSDLWGGAGWSVFGLLILGESLRMERYAAMGAELYTMPGFVPGLLGGVVLLLGIALMLRGWWRRSEEAGQGDAPAPLLNRRILLMLGFSITYAVLLIGHVPFWLATALFVSAFVASFTPTQAWGRRLAVALLAGVLTSAIVSLVFQQVFLVRLP